MPDSKDPKVLKIDESSPGLYVKGTDYEIIHFVNVTSYIDRVGIESVLKTIDSKKVRRIVLDGSLMEDLSILSFIPNVEIIYINSRKIRSIEGVVLCKRIKSVKLKTLSRDESLLKCLVQTRIEELVMYDIKKKEMENAAALKSLKSLQIAGGWSEADLKKINTLDLKYLRLDGCGALRSVDGIEKMRMEVAQFFGCRALFDLSAMNCRRLELDNCGKINVQSLACNKNLEYLRIRQNGAFDFQSFLKNCNALRTIAVAASKIENLSSRSFSNHSLLKAMWLSVSDKKLTEMAPVLPPGVAIGNGRMSFKDGVEYPEKQYQDLIYEGYMMVRYYDPASVRAESRD